MFKAFILAVVGTLVASASQVGLAQAPQSPSTIQLLQQRLAETDQQLVELRSQARARQSGMVLNEFDLQNLIRIADDASARSETTGMTPEQLAARQAEIDRLTQRLTLQRGEVYRLETEALRQQVRELQGSVADLQRQLRAR